MKAKLLAAAIAIALFLPAVPVRANAPGVVTIYAPFLCSPSTGRLVHSVCGEVAYTGRLRPRGIFQIPIVIPSALAFPKMQYLVQLTSNWDILKPPVTCIYTAQPLSPTGFAIMGTGCTFVPFAIGYTITGY